MKNDQLRQKIVKRERLIKIAVVLGLLIIGGSILLAIPGMLSSFLMAFVITYLFKPLVNWLERKGLSRTLAIIIPFTLAGAVIAGGSTLLIPRLTQQVANLQTELPKYVKGIRDLSQKHTKSLNSALSQYAKIDVAEKAGTWLEKSGTAVLTSAPEFLSQALTIMILAPFFAFFMLKDGRQWNAQLLTYVPNNLFEMSLNLVYQINQQLGGFIRARLLESIIVGLVVWIGLYFMSFPYAIFLSIFAGITNLIPYVGPLIGAAPAILVALVNEQGTGAVALVGLVYVIAQVVDMLFIIPLVIAKIVDLHPVTVVIVIIIGGQIMGVLGMIISIPVASIIKLIFTEFYNHVVDFRS